MSELNISGIGTRLRAARRRRGWTREALAYHAGISAAAIAQIEAGRRRNLRPATVLALSTALGVTADYLLSGSPSEPMLEHLAYVYDDDDRYLGTIGPFLEEGGGQGDGVLVAADAARIDVLRAHLGGAAATVEFVESAAWLASPAGAIDGFRDFGRRKLEAGAQWLRVVGEPIWRADDSSEIRRWSRFESLLNLVFAGWPMTMICPYDTRVVDPVIVGLASETHPHVIAESGRSDSESYTDPGGFVLGP